MKRELKNGLYHALAAVIILAPVAVFPNVAGFAVAGLYIGWVREFTEEQLKHPSKHWSEALFDALFSWRDLLGWTIGGAIIGLGVQSIA